MNVGAYDLRRHGPFGGQTLEEAYDNGQQHLALWKQWYNAGPWYAVAHNDGESGATVDVISSREWKPPETETQCTAYAGPFSDLEIALKAAMRRRRSVACSDLEFNWLDLFDKDGNALKDIL
jgi:hypothetical protein